MMCKIHFNILVISATLLGCASVSAPAHQPTDASVRHIVLVWLKDPGNTQNRTRVIEASKSLSSIPGVLDVAAGPVIKSEREIVDSTFDVGIVFTLKNEAALQSYLIHPLHIRAMKETLSPLVKKVLVYDLAVQ
jgi:hypothetical protein